MLAKKTPTVNRCKVQQCFPQHSVIGINSYEGYSTLRLNSTTNYSHISKAESHQFRCFETTLAICLTCDLTPDQAIQEFKEAYGQSSLPIYLDWWRSPLSLNERWISLSAKLWRGAEK